MVAVSNIVVAPQFGAQLAFSPNGKRFAAGGRDGTKLWDNETQSLITNLPPFGNAKLVGFSPDGNYLAAADTAGSVVVSTGLLPETARFEPGGEVVALGFSANSRLAVGCLRGIQGAASVFSLPSGQSLCCVPQTNLCALALSPDGSRLATVGPTPRNLRLGEVTPGKEYVILWNVATSNVIRKLPHDFDVTAVAFAPDGKHLATGMTGRTGNTDPINPRVTVWNLDDSTETLLEQERTPWSVAFSSDSQYMAVGGGDYARIWIWREQREIARLNYKHNVREVAFIDRDNSLTMLTQITGSQDAAEQLCCLWRWRPDYLVAQARSRITYRLSTNELRHYLGLAP
jgi:WD40 repeat protein